MRDRFFLFSSPHSFSFLILLIKRFKEGKTEEAPWKCQVTGNDIAETLKISSLLVFSFFVETLK